MAFKDKSQDPLKLISDLSAADVFYKIKSLSVFRSRSSSGYLFKLYFFVDENGIPEKLKLKFLKTDDCIEAVSLVVESHLRNNPKDVTMAKMWKLGVSDFSNNPSRGISIYRTH
jgi:hypothetical protein